MPFAGNDDITATVERDRARIYTAVTGFHPRDHAVGNTTDPERPIQTPGPHVTKQHKISAWSGIFAGRDINPLTWLYRNDGGGHRPRNRHRRKPTVPKPASQSAGWREPRHQQLRRRCGRRPVNAYSKNNTTSLYGGQRNWFSLACGGQTRDTPNAKTTV